VSKPDWAERLQRTFSRKYEQGYAKGYSLGISFGVNSAISRFREKEKTFQFKQERAFEHGQEMGRIRECERIIKLLEKANSSKTHSASNGCGLCQAIALIKGENK
jgi:hypothetical protein